MTINEFVKFADTVVESKKALERANREVAEINDEFGKIKNGFDKISKLIAEKAANMREETKKSVETYKHETSLYANLAEWLRTNRHTFEEKDVGFINVLLDDSISSVDIANSLATLRPLIFTRYLSETSNRSFNPRFKSEYNNLLEKKEKLGVILSEMGNRKNQFDTQSAKLEGKFISQKNAVVKDLLMSDLQGLERFYELNILQDLIAAKKANSEKAYD